MTTLRKKLGIVALAVSALLTIAGCSTVSGAPVDSTSSAAPKTLEHVRFGYIGDFNGTSLLAIAAAKGLWAKNGLEVETSVFTNGPLQIQALATGSLDFGYIGPGAMWLPASGQAKIVMVNTLGNADRVIAQPGITSLKDLKGKKIAVPQGTSGDMILTLALKSVGLTAKDVQEVPMDPSTVVAAFSSGQVDAAGIWYPLISTIKAQVPKLNELAKDSDFAKTVAFPTVFVAGTDVVKNKSKMVSKVLAALKEANDYRAANVDKTVALTAAMLKLDPTAVAADAKNSTLMTSAKLETLTKDGTITSWLTGMNDYFVAAGKLTAPVEPSTYYASKLFLAAGK